MRNVVKTVLKVILVDAVLLAGLYSVFSDLDWRTSYGSSVHDACGGPCSYSASFSHSVLTQFFTLSGNGVTLTSPPTLDWVQLLVLALVLINAWYAYGWLTTKRSAGAEGAMEQGPKLGS